GPWMRIGHSAVWLTLMAGAPLAAQERTKAVALTLAGRPVELSVSSVSEHTARMAILPLDAAGTTAPLTDDPVLPKRAWPSPVVRVRSAVGGPVRVKAGGVAVTISTDPLAIRFARDDGRQIQDLRIDRQSGAITFDVGASPVFGLGQGGPQFDRRGHAYPPKNDHGAYKLALYGGRMPVPWLVSASGWALFFHQPLGSIDLSGSEGRFTPSDAGPIDLFVVSGEPAVIMTEYARLTGFPALPPIWALGYIQSHRTLQDFAEVLRVAQTFREKKLPCDVLIYLGTGWCPSGWNTGHDSFAFNS